MQSRVSPRRQPDACLPGHPDRPAPRSPRRRARTLPIGHFARSPRPVQPAPPFRRTKSAADPERRWPPALIGGPRPSEAQRQTIGHPATAQSARKTRHHGSATCGRLAKQPGSNPSDECSPRPLLSMSELLSMSKLPSMPQRSSLGRLPAGSNQPRSALPVRVRWFLVRSCRGCSTSRRRPRRRAPAPSLLSRPCASDESFRRAIGMSQSLRKLPVGCYGSGTPGSSKTTPDFMPSPTVRAGAKLRFRAGPVWLPEI